MVRHLVRVLADDPLRVLSHPPLHGPTDLLEALVAATDLPKLITVPQAAQALRIGRSTAYDLAHAWLESNGAEGLPVVRIGRTIRVPVAALERLFAIGGFGPAWNSGLDRRRCPRPDGLRAPAHERPEPAPGLAVDEQHLADRPPAHFSATRQLSLFDEPEA